MSAKTAYTAAAREIVEQYIRTGRQWDTDTLAAYLPKGRRLRGDAVYSGPATIASIAAFLQSESVEAV